MAAVDRKNDTRVKMSYRIRIVYLHKSNGYRQSARRRGQNRKTHNKHHDDYPHVYTLEAISTAGSRFTKTLSSKFFDLVTFEFFTRAYTQTVFFKRCTCIHEKEKNKNLNSY